MLRIILYALVQIKSYPKVYIPNIPGVQKGFFFQLRLHLVANFWPTPRNKNSTSVEIFFVILFFFEYFRLLSFTSLQTTSCVTILRYFFLLCFYFVFKSYAIFSMHICLMCNETERIRCPCADKSSMISRSPITGK